VSRPATRTTYTQLARDFGYGDLSVYRNYADPTRAHKVAQRLNYWRLDANPDSFSAVLWVTLTRTITIY
jgi:hypothetical protein